MWTQPNKRTTAASLKSSSLFPTPSKICGMRQVRAHKNSYSAGDDPIFQAPDMAAAGDSGLARMEGLNSQPQYSSIFGWEN